MIRTIRSIEGIAARYDPEVDALAVDFPGAEAGASVRQIRLDGRRAIDLDASGKPISVEILFASLGVELDGLPRREAVAAAAADLGLPLSHSTDEPAAR